MNIQKLVDSLDSNELKNLAKAVEKKLEKSEMEKQIEVLLQAQRECMFIDFYGQKQFVIGNTFTRGPCVHTHEFELDNGSKIVFDLEGR